VTEGWSNDAMIPSGINSLKIMLKKIYFYLFFFFTVFLTKMNAALFEHKRLKPNRLQTSEW